MKMSIVDLVVLFILGLHPDWQGSYCAGISMNQEICQQKQEEGYATAQLFAPIFVQESERAELGPTGPFWLASVAMKENSLLVGDHCIITVSKDRLASVTELTPSPLGERRAQLCVNLADGRQSCRHALVLEETNIDYRLNYCMAGEAGTFQLTRYEASAGTVVPATGQPLPRSYAERRALLMDPTVNTSLAAAALKKIQIDCCGDNESCREDWSNWIGAYNTGSCSGARSWGYATRVSGYYHKGLDYMCSQEAVVENRVHWQPGEVTVTLDPASADHPSTLFCHQSDPAPTE